MREARLCKSHDGHSRVVGKGSGFLPFGTFGTVAIAGDVHDHGMMDSAAGSVFRLSGFFMIFHGLGVGIFAVVRVTIFADAAAETFTAVDVPKAVGVGWGIFFHGLAWTGGDGCGGVDFGGSGRGVRLGRFARAGCPCHYGGGDVFGNFYYFFFGGLLRLVGSGVEVPFGIGQFDFAAVVVAMLEADEVAGDFAEAFPTFVAVGDFVEGVEVFGHFGEDEAGEVFEEVFGAFVSYEFCALFVHVLESILAVPVAEPIFVAAMAPFGEVLFGDGFAGEVFVERFPGFGQFVEPREQGGAEFAVEEAEV